MDSILKTFSRNSWPEQTKNLNKPWFHQTKIELNAPYSMGYVLIVLQTFSPALDIFYFTFQLFKK